MNPVEVRQEQERREREALRAAAADADQRAAIVEANDAQHLENLANPNYRDRLDASRLAAQNRDRGQREADLYQAQIHAAERAQRDEAAAAAWAASAAAAAAQIRQQRGNNPEAAAWDRATQIPIPGGRRHRKTRKHSRKHTKKNRKVSRRKMTRRRR